MSAVNNSNTYEDIQKCLLLSFCAVVFTLFFTVGLFGDAKILLGGVFVIIALHLLPIKYATIVLLASLSAQLRIEQPWYLLVFHCLEFICIALLLYRSVFAIFASFAYWFCVGIPLLFCLLYFGSEALKEVSAIITISTSYNGLLNAALAVSILIFIPLRFQHSSLTRRQYKLASNIFSLCASTLTLPLIIFSFLFTTNNAKENEANIQDKLVSNTKLLTAATESFIREHIQVIEQHANLINIGVPIPAVHTSMAIAQAKMPTFFNITTADRDGTLLFFAPTHLNESVNRLPIELRNVSERDYFIEAMVTRKTVISDAIMSKGVVVEPMISIATPTVQNEQFSGIVFGAIHLGAINEFKNTVEQLLPNKHVVITDNLGRTVFTDDKIALAPLAQFTPFPVYHYITELLPVARVGGNSFIYEHRMNEYGWHIYVLHDTKNAVNDIENNFIVVGIGIIFVICLFLFFAHKLSTKITAPLVDLLNPEGQRHTKKLSMLGNSKEFSDVANKLKRTQFLMQSFEDRLKQQVTEKTVQLEQLNLQLAAQAREDGMTQLLNRSGFDELAINAIKTSYRLNQPFSLALLDIDHFKTLNDSYGHPFGDKCLQAFAALMQRNCKRETDIIGRYGGEEFIILMSGKDVQSHHKMMQKIHQQTMALSLTTQDGEHVSFTVSVGICSILGNVNLNLHDIVELADEELYKCKRTGRNKISSVTYGYTNEEE
ncbi:sensor domain-containing diguanylate cyclase [Agaribacter marinus]|uniref:sensor domain-containing diguanylate cyclase n=1 Tax=Agaribacter marinus TaxID=1431249 RepID=UPI0024E0706A|nr:diguanylate cyclase [Agaribacter marinus]